jgi:DNA-binding MarR family transcriptional regulator
MSTTKHNLAPVSTLVLEAPPSTSEYGKPLGLVGQIRRAYLSISRCRDLIFAPYGVTTDQYTLLNVVNNRGEIKQSELSVIMFTDANTISSMVRLLQKKGLLTRTPDPSDNRARLVKLTRSGVQMLQYLSRDWAPMRKRLSDCLDNENGQIALSILKQITAEMTIERTGHLESLQPAHANGTARKRTTISLQHKR